MVLQLIRCFSTVKVCALSAHASLAARLDLLHQSVGVATAVGYLFGLSAALLLTQGATDPEVHEGLE